MPSLDRKGQSFMSSWNDGICKSCTVLGGTIGLQMADGSDALKNNVYVHHILSFDTSKRTSSFIAQCPTADGKASPGTASRLGAAMAGIGGTSFLGVGEDNGNGYKLYTSEDGSFDSGFHIGANDRFSANVDLVNYNEGPVDVYVTMEMEYVPGNVGLDSYGALLNVQGCNMGSKLNMNGTTTSQRFPVLSDGAIVSARKYPSPDPTPSFVPWNWVLTHASQAATSTPAVKT